MRTIVLLKRWLLWIDKGYCMGTKNKKHPDIKWINNKALYWFGVMGNCLDHLQLFDRNSRESGLAGLYLQSVGLKCSKKEWWSFLSKMLQNGYNSVEQPGNSQDHSRGSEFILEVQSDGFIFIFKVPSINWDNIKGIVSKTLIKSQYLVSHGQSIQQHEWRFACMSMNVAFPPILFPFPLAPLQFHLQPKLLQLLHH